MAKVEGDRRVSTGRDLPISVKGVLVVQARFLLVRQRNGLWELPGGKPEGGESREATLLREIEEETGVAVRPGPVIDRWVRHKPDGRRRLVIVYHCRGDFTSADLRLSPEHVDYGLFPRAEIDGLPMLDGYKRSLILAAHSLAPA